MRTVSQTIQWAAALVVVRLLTPADYGLVAMATAFLGVVNVFTEFGLGAAIIQRHELSADQISRLGGVSLTMSTVLALLSVAASGLVASFFQEPRVRLVIIVMSSTFVFSGLDVVSRSLLRRDLQFRRLAWVEGSQSFAYAAASVTFAAIGLGYWSLVLASVLGVFARMAIALKSRWHPIAWPRDLRSVKSELWFGGHVVISRLALTFRRFADVLVVGRLLGTEALGSYNVGKTQANMPVDRGTQVIHSMTPSVLATVQDDPPALRRYIRIFTEAITLLSFPATFGIALVADDFVLFVFGERWAATIGPLRVLALVAAVQSIIPILSQTLLAKDEAKKNMQFSVASAVIVPIFLLMGSPWGTTGVAFGWLIGLPLVTILVHLRNALRIADMPVREYLSAFRPAALAGGVMVVTVVAARAIMPSEWPLIARFATEVSVGAGVYVLGILSLYRDRLAVLISLLRSPPSPKTADSSASS
jgi:PST family polysaccharide transporter